VKVTNFFSQNTDPYAIMYLFFTGSSNGDVIAIVSCLRIQDSANPAQPSYDDTFADVLSGLVQLPGTQVFTGPYIATLKALDALFEVGKRRRVALCGPQVTKVSPSYLQGMYSIFKAYVIGLVSRGDNPVDSVWVLQFMHPSLNGNAPASDADTSWPHSTIGHQTGFAPYWRLASSDEFVRQTMVDQNMFTRYYQKQLGGPPVHDYPNYISPDATGSHVYGKNLERLENIKDKYDPLCLLRQGRVFKSQGCAKVEGLTFY